MRSEEFSAKTIEEAVKKAMEAFGVTKDELIYEVTTEPTKGFLGIGARHAVIKASVKEAEIIEQKEDYLVFDIQGEELGILIGRRGDTLDALQFLLNLVINRKSSSKIKVIIDIENYRAKREETLVGLSHKLAAKARRTGQKVILEPMNPQERRIIHMTLQDDDTVNTYSEGEEPYRKVIIVPKKKQQNRRK